MILGKSYLDLIIQIPAILLALTIHECAHAWMAWKKGDDTAMMMGRISLNPLAHLDLLGTLAMVVTGFIGWAKPVPVNGRNFRNLRQDMALVALAGPLANIALAALAFLTLWLALRNMALVAGFLPSGIYSPLMGFAARSMATNIAFAVLNLIPVPPLDGFNVLSMFLSRQAIDFCQRYQMVFMMALVIFVAAGPFGDIVSGIIRLVISLF
ncbi:MAG: site-2 protease family protein [Deltaproteobacteria bacterium]|jgi:Zn-dependent protease|nr:site-2 protease family protein [Deltaproteobacteria bacterium]